MTPETAVREATRRLSAALVRRDLAAAMACFTDDAAVFGDAGGEEARGGPEVAVFLEEVLEEPWVLGWEVLDVHARARQGWVWFVADADAVQAWPDGLVERVPVRLDGLLSEPLADGTRRFEVLTVNQPVGLETTPG
ncbi:YybH family protein [Nocardioides bruguierae]|uniref:Nuclear transport factor 2 family protein n=1 Tax=Nocardioides bruguierae TaxID=2945102 RepID=A0A9X2D7I0_9ACTN|nr:nuclear transport factor 2 family protein [Nocardioides bruguierae]MCL8024608.1 nuclear transport factor 2 family protein [Nocardioides bruguierae]MCM0620775.1 nuclear transport factor 2 family protein [Nocardioides bruguierae]